MNHADNQSAAAREFTSIWRAADKIVFSRTLEEASTERTAIERRFDREHIQELKRVSDRDITVGGAELAGQAIAAGLVDECHLLLAPVIVGAGKHALPSGVKVALELLDERRFESGFAHLSYRIGPVTAGGGR